MKTIHGAIKTPTGFAVSNDPQARTFATLTEAMQAAGELNRRPVAVATEPRYWKQDGTPVFKRRERVKEEW